MPKLDRKLLSRIAGNYSIEDICRDMSKMLKDEYVSISKYRRLENKIKKVMEDRIKNDDWNKNKIIELEKRLEKTIPIVKVQGDVLNGYLKRIFGNRYGRFNRKMIAYKLSEMLTGVKVNRVDIAEEDAGRK